MALTIGSLCTGYGGLDMGVERVLDADMIWYSENDRYASTLLEARFPGIPNLGDLTALDWSAVPPVDILTGGYPCQPFSSAGHRKGEDDDRHLWPYIREAIRTLRPRITFLENVAGHRNNGFSSVLADLAEDGLHVRWVSLRASEVEAPHSRDRLFFSVQESPNSDGFRLEERRARIREESEVSESSGGGFPDREGWGEYGPSINRWERATENAAPYPVVYSPSGIRYLNPEFSEWMMGLPAGWVSGEDLLLPWTARVRILGNGAVPQQAEKAIRSLLEDF